MKKKYIALFIGISLFSVLMLHNRMRNYLIELGSFSYTFVMNPTKIGSFIPSSPYLSESMTRHITSKTKDKPIKVLEVGAGTGVITEKILERIGTDDLVDIIELDPILCGILEKKFNKYKNLQVRCMSILDWDPAYQYDFIVSALPFNAFESVLVAAILEKYKKLIKPDGIITYFEYIWLYDIKKFFLSGDQEIDFIATLDITTAFRDRFGFDTDIILLNIPPAYVYSLRVPIEKQKQE